MALTLTQRNFTTQLYNNTTRNTNNEMIMYDIGGNGQVSNTSVTWTAGSSTVSISDADLNIESLSWDATQWGSIPNTNKYTGVVYDNGGTLQTPNRFRLTTDQSDGINIGDGTALGDGAAWNTARQIRTQSATFNSLVGNSAGNSGVLLVYTNASHWAFYRYTFNVGGTISSWNLEFVLGMGSAPSNSDTINLSAYQNGQFSDFAGITDLWHFFRWNDTNHYFLADDISGTTTKTVNVADLIPALDTSTASSGTINVHERHSYTDLYNTMVTANASGGALNGDGFAFTVVEENEFLREYQITYTGTGHRCLNVTGWTQEERPGITRFRIQNATNYIIWLGYNGGTWAAFSTGDRTFGLARSGVAVGRTEIVYNQNPFKNYDSGSSGIRPNDNRTRNDGSVSSATAMSAHKYLGLLGGFGGRIWSPDVPSCEFLTVIFEGNDTQTNRYDLNFVDSSMTGQINFGFINNNNPETNNIGQFYHLAQRTYTANGYLYGKIGTAPQIQGIAASNIKSTDPINGATDNAIWPESYPLVPSIGPKNTDNFAEFFPRGDSSFNATGNGAGVSYTVKNAPYQGFRARRWGFTDTAGFQVPHFFVNLTTDDPGAVFVNKDNNTATGGNLFGTQQYQIKFLEPDQTENTTGWVIRKRNTTAMTGGSLSYTATQYTGAAKEYANHNFDYYGWKIDQADNRKGYNLDWFLAPTASNGNQATRPAIVFYGDTSAETYDVYIGTPGKAVNKRDALRVYNSTTNTLDRTTGVSDNTYTQEIWPGYASGQVQTISYDDTAQLTGITFPTANNLRKMTLEAGVTGRQFVSTLMYLPQEMVNDFDALTNANKTTTTAYWNATGYFNDLLEFECEMVSTEGLVATITEISSSDTSEVEFGTVRVTSDTYIDTLKLEHGKFTLANEYDGRTAVNLDGDFDHTEIFTSLPTAAQYSMRDVTTLNGELTVDTGSNTGIVYYKFADCARTGTFNIEKSGSATTVRVIDAPAGTTGGDGVEFVKAVDIILDCGTGNTIDVADTSRFKYRAFQSSDGSTFTAVTATVLNNETRNVTMSFIIDADKEVYFSYWGRTDTGTIRNMIPNAVKTDVEVTEVIQYYDLVNVTTTLPDPSVARSIAAANSGVPWNVSVSNAGVVTADLYYATSFDKGDMTITQSNAVIYLLMSTNAYLDAMAQETITANYLTFSVTGIIVTDATKWQFGQVTSGTTRQKFVSQAVTPNLTDVSDDIITGGDDTLEFRDTAQVAIVSPADLAGLATTQDVEDAQDIILGNL